MANGVYAKYAKLERTGPARCVRAMINGDKLTMGNVFVDTIGGYPSASRPAVFSYGHHWPLAVLNPDGSVFVQAERNSISTNCQRSKMLSGLISEEYTATDEEPVLYERHLFNVWRKPAAN